MEEMPDKLWENFVKSPLGLQVMAKSGELLTRSAEDDVADQRYKTAVDFLGKEQMVKNGQSQKAEFRGKPRAHTQDMVLEEAGASGAVPGASVAEGQLGGA